MLYPAQTISDPGSCLPVPLSAAECTSELVSQAHCRVGEFAQKDMY